MKITKLMVSLVAVLALAVLMTVNVSAFANIRSVEIAGAEGLNSVTGIAAFAGQTVPVRVIFDATSNASFVRVKADLVGGKDYVVSSEIFDVVKGNTYTALIALVVPSDINPDEKYSLEITVENQENGIGDRETINLLTQRESYNVAILDVSMDNQVKAGDSVSLNIVLKNTGRHLAEDTFVRVSIPALGIERKAYFGDLSAVDQGEDSVDGSRQDAAERRMFLNIPSSAQAGIYTVQLEAYNADSSSTAVRKIAVTGASEDSMVVSPVNSKTFAAGDSAEYSLTLVNSGSNVKVYQLSFEAPSGLSLSSDDSVVAIPAGTSKTVKVAASASKAGSYDFAVNVYSDAQLVKRQAYAANIEGSKGAGNATVVLTVILAIIFVVLLVVLIVLLTRKPEKAEEFGESYY